MAMKHFESFESNRWVWRINFSLQVVLVVALVLVVNLIGMSLWARYDLTRNKSSSLSEEAIALIHDLDRRTGIREGAVPVNITVTLTGDSDDADLDQVYRDVRGILRQFEYAARENEHTPIHVEFLNVYQNRTRAEALGLADLPNVVVFRYRDYTPRIVQLSDLYVSTGRERQQFVGEKAFVSALLDVTSEERPVLYFLTGHGEMRLNDIDPARGASQLDAGLRARAYDTQELDLSATRRVPADAGIVIILAPQTPLLRSEQEILRDYLARRAGRLIIALNPGREHGLDDLLFEWGVLSDDVLVIENDARFRTEAGDLLVRGIAPEHPITRPLYDNQVPLVLGATRSARPDPGRAIDDALVVTALLHSSAGEVRNQPSSWGEFNYRAPGAPVFDRGRDLIGPIVFATVAERRVQPDLRVNVQGGRLLVFGTGDFLANNRIGALGNSTFFLNAVNWALDPARNIDIPARPIERLKLNLSQQQLRTSGFAIVLGPALLVTLWGLVVYFSRRR